MTHPLLDPHDCLGIDIDSTLINGPCSRILQEWCRDNHTRKQLHLITFRYGKDFDLAQQDIIEGGAQWEWFRSIHGAPRALFERHYQYVQQTGHIRNNPRKLARAIAHHRIDTEDMARVAREVTLWKGIKCKELGCTALVDDLVEYVQPGCDLHGITLVDSLKL